MNSDIVHDWMPIVFCIVFEFTIFSMFTQCLSIFCCFLMFSKIFFMGVSQAKVCLGAPR